MKKRLTIFYASAFSLLLLSGQLHVKELDEQKRYKLTTIISGIDVPWGMEQLPDGRFLISERSGELLIVDSAANKRQEIKGLPEIDSRGQGGLLDIKLHPNYAKNNWIYFSYSSPAGRGKGSNTAVMRAKLKNDALGEKSVLYKASPNSTRGQHFGSRIEFDDQGYLYFSIGDRGDRDVNPQNLKRDGGKIYRLYDDGSIPEDNPFIEVKGAKKAIYSFGHRNPQGMGLHPVTGDIWVHEHGPKGGDELNLIEKGKNYGWPIISYGTNYNGSKFTELTEKRGMVQPKWFWVPSIAPSGMAFITSDKYPEWKGHLLVGSLKFSYLVLCYLEGSEVRSQKILFEGIGRVRNVKQMPDGFIYVATENDKIVRIEPLK